MSVYELGSPIRIGPETFTDITGALVDPSTVAVTIQKPDGTIDGPFTLLAAQVIRESVGRFHFDYTPTMVGRYAYEWASTGIGATVVVSSFDVESTFASGGGIVTVGDVRNHATFTDSVTDADLRTFIGAATTVIERWVGPVAQRNQTEVFYNSGGKDVLYLRNYPVISIQSVTDGLRTGTPVTLGSPTYELDPVTSSLVRVDGGQFIDKVTVTFLAGRVSVPKHIRKAALNYVTNEVRRVKSSGTSTFGEAGFTTAPDGLDNIVKNDLRVDPYFRGTTVG